MEFHIGWDVESVEIEVIIPVNGHTHMSVDIIMCLEGCSFPLCCEEMVNFLEEHFGFAPECFVNGDKKLVEVFLLVPDVYGNYMFSITTK